MSDYLLPLKKKFKTHKLASFDVETADETNDFYMVGIYSDKGYRAFYDQKEAYEYLRTRLKGYWVIATNLGFDITSLFFNTEYWNEFDIISNGGFMLSAKNSKLGIQFLDTLNWHKASVAQLGKIINMPKLDHPSFLGKRKPLNPCEEKTLRDYNKRDCEISYYFSLWLQEQINKIGGELKITIASTALDIWKRKFNKKVLVKEDRIFKKRGIETNLRNKIFNAYYGGRTETLQRGYYEDLYYYDFNSLYPSVMVNKLPLPNSVCYHKEGSIKDLYHREGVSFVTIEHVTDELPLLPYRYNGKLTFPTGKITGWWTHLEIRKAVENGYILHDVKETISYSLGFYPFNEYVNIFYDKRLEAKKKGDSSQLIYKILMNSLYGKFGERKHKIVKHFDFKTVSDKELKEIRSHHESELSINDDGKGYFTYEEECNSAHVFPILPVYITAMARIKLWEKARTLDPLYMDTDSIVTKQKLPSSNKLGELELEHKIDKAIFIKPKMYYFKDGEEEIIRMKGVPHATKKQFKQVLDKDSIEYTKFVKLKEGIRRNLKVNSILKMTKSLDLEDNKREWITPFSLIPEKSKPLKIKEEKQDEKHTILLHEITVTNRRKIDSNV